MKKFTIILAVLAVLSMAGTTFADLMIAGNTYEEGTDLGNGLRSYTVTITGSTKFQDIQLYGGTTGGLAHQVNMVYGGVLTPTIYPADLASNAGAAQYDTHLLFAAGEASAAGTLPYGYTETNTGNNPGGIGDYDLMPYNTFGMGTFTSYGDWGFAFTDLSMLTEPKDFIQVVLPDLTSVRFAGTYLDAQEQFQTFDELVGVPEPSTIVMLVVGGLCLLVARFRK